MSAAKVSPSSAEEGKAGGVPKKPLTAFFMFMMEEKTKGNNIKPKDGGKMWNEMPEDKKKPFLDRYYKAKAAYDKYLVEVEGIQKKSDSHNNTEYGLGRVRAVLTSQATKQLDPKIYKGCAKFLEAFFEDFGKNITETAKNENTKIANIDIVEIALNRNAKLNWIPSNF